MLAEPMRKTPIGGAYDTVAKQYNGDRIRQLFSNPPLAPGETRTRHKNNKGVYGVIMTKNGKEEHVIIDDLIPVRDGDQTVFAHGNGPELWVILLEKAWAKLHGSYERQIGGIAYQTIRDLTGAPGYTYPCDKMEPDFFDKMVIADESEFIMTAGIHSAEVKRIIELRNLGLVPGHSFGILEVRTVTMKNTHKEGRDERTSEDKIYKKG